METAQVLLRGAGGLLAVLGTLWVCIRVVKARTGATGSTPVTRLRVIARASLGRHAGVVSVDVGDRVLVLGVGEHGVRLLAELPALPEVVPVTERAGVELAGATPPRGVTAQPVPAPRSPLGGSLVDPATWRAVVTVARERTVRR